MSLQKKKPTQHPHVRDPPYMYTPPPSTANPQLNHKTAPPAFSVGEPWCML